jgi:Na+/phosphate symporter
MSVIGVIQLFGGVGLFLYGMSMMGAALKKLAGSGMQSILEKLTSGKSKIVGILKGWGLGTLVTGIIQSSSATTMMLIGFVNAGIMKLIQAVPVVFGANVGSTFTAQILRLGDLGSGTIILKLLKPSSFAPALIAIGAAMHIFGKKKKTKDLSELLIGLGVLFFGMTSMEKVFEPLKESESFQKLFVSFSNPLVGILVGIVLTAVIQSSSAAVGILQSLSVTGSLTFATSIPFIIGQNIGKCMTVILGGIGADKKAKRVALTYLMFNVFSCILITAVIYGIYYTVGISWFGKVVNRGDIANVHLLFNLIPSILFLPFSEAIAKLTGKMLHDRDDEEEEVSEFKVLDERLLDLPSFALGKSRELVIKMFERVIENYNTVNSLLTEFDEKAFSGLNQNEKFIDQCETVLSNYIISIEKKKLNEDERRVVVELLNSISDIERMGDYAMNIAFIAQEKKDAGIVFTENGEADIKLVEGPVSQCINDTFAAFKDNDVVVASRIEVMKAVIDEMNEKVKAGYIERLESGKCSIQAGVSLLDILNAYERLAGHASNVASHVIKRANL